MKIIETELENSLQEQIIMLPSDAVPVTFKKIDDSTNRYYLVSLVNERNANLVTRKFQVVRADQRFQDSFDFIDTITDDGILYHLIELL